MTADEAMRETLALVNEFFPGASPWGTFGLGAIAGIAQNYGVVPSRELLSSVQQLYSLEATLEACEKYRDFLGSSRKTSS